MKLLCLGDSLTYGYEVRRQAVWPRLVAQDCGIIVKNRGVNGSTTQDMLQRFPLTVLKEKPEIVLIMGGANDILFHNDRPGAQKNLESMAEATQEADIKLILGIPTPIEPPIREDWAGLADFTRAKGELDLLAGWLYDFCNEKGIPQADFRSDIAVYAAEQGIQARSLYIDGLHLNEEGHNIFAATLITLLRNHFLEL